MVYEKIVEGSNEFCKVVTTSINMKTKATLEKEKKDLEDQYKLVTDNYTKGMAELEAQLAVFQENHKI